MRVVCKVTTALINAETALILMQKPDSRITQKEIEPRLETGTHITRTCMYKSPMVYVSGTYKGEISESDIVDGIVADGVCWHITKCKKAVNSEERKKTIECNG